MDLINVLQWRYATKRMNGNTVPEEKIDRILEAIRLSASSMGLQPYSVIVVKDPAIKKQLSPAAYNQPQIVESSHLLIFAAWESITEEKVDAYLSFVAKTREISIDSLAGFKGNFTNGILSRDPQTNFDWAARQAYIALGTGLIAAANEQVDATPMEGFNPAAVDEILKLREKGLKSVAILALGYRDTASDYLNGAKKVRRAKEEFVVEL